jgi:uncharacterized repeat protein (TIGR01451 family)
MRARVFGLLAALLILSTSLTGPVAVVEAAEPTFSAGSLVIPMDTTYQNYGMWRAYGLVYNLLSHGIPVSWAINPDKTFNGTDFTASAVDLRTAAVIGSHNYSGGPFIIDSAHAAQATPLIQAWWAKYANQPVVHTATAPFTANVDIVLKSPPRIANEAINAGISIAYYNAAGIPDLNGNPWSTTSPNILDQTEIANGALFSSGACSSRNFDVFVTPHNGGYSYSLTDPTNLGTRAYAQLDYFVQQGGGWIALCDSIVSNENAIARLYKYSSPSVRELFRSTVTGGFLTLNGFSTISNKGGAWTVTEPALPVAQAVSTTVAQALPGGSVQTWPRTSVSYYSQTEKIAHFSSAGAIHDFAINGVYHDGDGLGKVTYLGGHSYSTSLPYSSNFEAPYLRFFYNALFFNGAAVAKLDLTTSPLAIPQGLTSTVTIKLSNTGSSTATNANDVQIDLAAGVTYVNTIEGPPPVVSGDPGIGTTLSWASLDDIDGGQTALEIQVQMTPSATGDTGIAHLSAWYGDVYDEAFTADLCRSIYVYPAPVPQITKEPGVQTVYTGGPLTWTIAYRNSGSSPLLEGVVEDILPVGFVYAGATPSPSSVLPLPGGTTRIRWYVGTLPAGSTPATISLSAYASGTVGSHTNSVALYGKDAYGVSYDATDTADVGVVAPPVTLAKTVSPDGAVDVTTPGQVLTYTLRPSYNGTELLDSVLVSDPVPAYADYVSGSANAGGVYGYVSLPQIDGLNDADQVIVTASVSPTTAAVGGTVTITVTLTNRTGGTLTNVRPDLWERLGDAIIPVPSPTSVASLANGASATFTYSGVQMTQTGARSFQADGIATQSVPDDYSFAEARSNTVLVTSFLDAVDDIVTWRLGSNTAGIPGQTLISGFNAGIYGFRGANTKEFSKYVFLLHSWITRAQPTNGIEKGGALTVDPSTHTIYASEGNSKWFYKYDIATNTWTRLADASDNFNEGGAVQYLQVGSNKYVYAILGNSNRFRRYNIGTSAWAPVGTLANTPWTVKQGGALTTDGTYLYALQGDAKKGFARYNVATNTWTAMTSTPENVRWGGALTTVGSYIYALRGDGKKDFWRYDIANNSWSSMAPAPGNVNEGGALTNDGTYIYAFQGKTKEYWRYDVALNTWSLLPTVNFTGNVGQGGALVYDPGVPTRGYYGIMVADHSLVTTGDTVTLTLTLESSEAVTNVNPTSVTLNGTNGVSTSLVSGPTLVSADKNIADINDPVVYTWTYTVSAAAVTPLPGILTFTAGGTGTGTGGAVTFPAAVSRGIIVTPELTYQVRVFDAASLPQDVSQIVNFGMITASTLWSPGVESNRTATPLLEPNLLITKSNAPAGPVSPGDVITYTLTVSNEGLGTATDVVVTDDLSPYVTYVTDSGSPTPTLLDPLTFALGTLAADESETITFQVQVRTDLAAGSYTIENSASVTANEVTPVTSDTVYNTVDVAASLEVIKTTDPDEVSAAGEVITYTIAVINAGNVPLTGINIIDSLVTLTRGGDSPGDNDAVLDVGEVWTYTGTYVVQQSDINTNGGGDGFIENTVTVDSDQTEPAFDSADVHIVVLDVTKTASPQVMTAPGTVTYTYTVTNLGGVRLDPVTLVDDLAGPVTLAASFLEPGESTTGTVTYIVTQAMIDAGLPIVNIATATGVTPVELTVTATATATVFITDEPYPALSLVKTGTWNDVNGDGLANAGDTISYRFTVTNTGVVMLTNITVTDPLVTVSGGPLASLAPGASDSTTFTASYTIVPEDIEAGYVYNTATADSNENSPATDDETVMLDQSAGLLLTKTGTWYDANGDGYANVGEPINYRFTVTNTGTVPLTNITVTDPLVTVSGGPLASLAPGASNSTTFTAVYVLTQTDIDAGTVTNTATATGYYEGQPYTDTDDDTQTFNNKPPYFWDKEITPFNYFTAWVSQLWTVTDEVDFEAGVLLNVDTDTSPGDVLLATGQTSGSIASQVLDTGVVPPLAASWDLLAWDETLASGTDITFEVRASDTLFSQSDGTLAWISVGGMSPVLDGLPDGRYKQWRATLTTSTSNLTPILHEVRVWYDP